MANDLVCEYSMLPKPMCAHCRNEKLGDEETFKKPIYRGGNVEEPTDWEDPTTAGEALGD